MRITSRGQITIPVKIRNALDWAAGTPVEVEIDGASVRIRRSGPAPRARGATIVERLRERGDRPRSTDEIMALTRGE